MPAIPSLARRYELVREELGETIHLNETLGAPSARALDKLMRQIDAEPKRGGARRSISARACLNSSPALSPRTLAWSAAAAAVAIVLQAGLIAGVVLNQPAAGALSDRLGAGDRRRRPARYALVRFAPHGERGRHHASSCRATSSASSPAPWPAGSTGSASPTPRLPQAERDKLIKTLQADKVVGFIAATK